MSAVDTGEVTELPDGSVAVVLIEGRQASIDRRVNGRRVWGQVFSGNDVEAHAADCVRKMREHPEAFTRPWDDEGRAL